MPSLKERNFLFTPEKVFYNVSKNKPLSENGLLWELLTPHYGLLIKHLFSSTCFARNYLQLQLQYSKKALESESKYPITHSIGLPQVDNLLTGYTVLEVFTSTK